MKKLILFILLSLTFGSQALAQDCSSRLQGMINASGVAITSPTPCVAWMSSSALTIPHGDGLAGDMLIAEQDGVIVIGGVVQLKSRLNLSADQLQKLMQLNGHMDFVKAGIDDDGDLFVRGELRSASITTEDFNIMVKQVIAGSASAYALLN